MVRQLQAGWREGAVDGLAQPHAPGLRGGGRREWASGEHAASSSMLHGALAVCTKHVALPGATSSQATWGIHAELPCSSHTWGRMSRRVSTMRMSGLSLEDQPSRTMVVICGRGGVASELHQGEDGGASDRPCRQLRTCTPSSCRLCAAWARPTHARQPPARRRAAAAQLNTGAAQNGERQLKLSINSPRRLTRRRAGAPGAAESCPSCGQSLRGCWCA